MSILHKALIFSLLLAILFGLGLWFSSWKNNLYQADSWGYYIYLPSTFLYHDLPTLDSAAAVRTQYCPMSMGFGDNDLGIVEINPTNNGKYCIKYTMGVAVLQAPFFLIGHLAAKISGLPADGFSSPYLFAILLSAIFYPLLGVCFLGKTLRKYFGKTTVALVSLGLLFGTNLTYFSTVNIMSHSYLFFLFCLLLFATDKWYEKQGESRPFAALIGFSAGMIALIRPNEAICLVFPLLWGVTSWKSLGERVVFFRQKKAALALAALVFIGVCIPQSLYWHWVSGEWAHDSYPNEHFDFTAPHIMKGLFGYKNGWLVYTPLMILALVGLVFLPRYNAKPMLPLAIFLPIHLWVIYSWWAWTWVNGFGSRPMVETYPLLAFPLAALLEKTLSLRWLKWSAFAAIGFFIWLNVLQTWQQTKAHIWSQSMNRSGYWASFGKTEFSKDILKSLDNNLPPPPKRLQFERLLLHDDFEEPFDSNFNQEFAPVGKFCYHLKSAYKPTFSATFQELAIGPGDWLRLSVMVRIPPLEMVCNRHENSFLVLELQGGKVRTESIRLQNKVGAAMSYFDCGEVDKWEEVYFFMKIPNVFPKSSSLKLYAHKPDSTSKTVYLDEMKIELWQ